ncbi:MAG TPA: adenylate/guanylate cyclase domain-containing protein [Chitinophagaceae bacterium]|nr:adenylate/guanylate cyclase domain-containing protein [Chitinophagaceae bacterium]
MEQNVALLIADLSGYTAMTEMHGGAGAADLIDAFLEIVKESLAGDSHLHQRTGDEVLIVSSSPDHLLATAILLLQKTSGRNNFLQLHGGLHYGTILKRNNDYFGTTINLTARIAAHANAGSFCCSSEFKNALTNPEKFRFDTRGNHQFKNLADEIEVYELSIDQPPFYIDPVCRMLINEMENAISHPDKQDLLFCSSDCLDIYIRKNIQLPS